MAGDTRHVSVMEMAAVAAVVAMMASAEPGNSMPEVTATSLRRRCRPVNAATTARATGFTLEIAPSQSLAGSLDRVA
jgi:hypothetical protein